MDDAGPRYAVYFAPDPAGALWRFGSSCIGYDAHTGYSSDFLVPAGVDEVRWRDLTEEPRRYGFHATLKAPFHLRDWLNEDELVSALRGFASRQPAFMIAGLRLATISRFVALVPAQPSAELQDLAASAVETFETFRKPLSEKDVRRRLQSPLTERQRRYLDRWGYPYVLDEFRFHMTLTGPLDESVRDSIRADLAREYAKAVGVGPVAVDAVALFRQDRRDGRFRIILREPLSGKGSA